MMPHDPHEQATQTETPTRAPTVEEFASVGGITDALASFLRQRGEDEALERIKREAQASALTVRTTAAIGAAVVVGAFAISSFFAARQAKRRAEIGVRFLDEAIEARTGVAGVASGRGQAAKAARDVPSWMRDAVDAYGCGCASCSEERRR